MRVRTAVAAAIVAVLVPAGLAAAPAATAAPAEAVSREVYPAPVAAGLGCPTAVCAAGAVPESTVTFAATVPSCTTVNSLRLAMNGDDWGLRIDYQNPCPPGGPTAIEITLPLPQTVADQFGSIITDPVFGVPPTALPDLTVGPGLSPWARIQVLVESGLKPTTTVYRPGDASLAGPVAVVYDNQQPCTTKAAKLTRMKGQKVLVLKVFGNCFRKNAAGRYDIYSGAVPYDKYGRIVALPVVGKPTPTRIKLVVPSWWRGKTMKFESGVVVRLP